MATTYGLRLDDSWDQNGRRRTVVGLVENPLNLRDRSPSWRPARSAPPDHVDVLIRATPADFAAKPRPDSMSAQLRSDDADTASVIVLVLATIGLLFVGLLAVAGFTVMAQRRLRALGMLGALGASHRHIRLVLLANGAVVGGFGALAGAFAGLAVWVALGPRLEPSLNHRIDRFNLPWRRWPRPSRLAIVTALVAAWWPARAAARIPVVAALSARPAPPRPAHRFAALGAVLLAGGLISLYLPSRRRCRTSSAACWPPPSRCCCSPRSASPPSASSRGMRPLAPRLAMRDLARYRARSGAALAAIALAVGIAAVVALGAGVAVAKAAAPTGGSLPADQVVVWLSSERMNGPIPALSADQLADMRKQVDAIAAELRATSVLQLAGAVDPNGRSSEARRPAAGRAGHTAPPSATATSSTAATR